MTVPESEPRTATYRHQVRYFETDQQGVVFNMWYLGYFDEALAHYLADGGVPYQTFLDAGLDFQLVRSEIDWGASLRWADEFRIDTRCVSVGRTSFVLRFAVYKGDDQVASGRTVYVVVATDGSGKRPVPDWLLPVLGRARG